MKTILILALLFVLSLFYPAFVLADPTPELQHYNWNANMTNDDCGYCHAAPATFLSAGFESDPGFCMTCHNASGTGHGKNVDQWYGHSLFVDATTFGRKKPSYGNITAAEYNNQPLSRLYNGNLVVCVTCHNVMQKPEDVGRTWELTTTTDQLTYTLQNGGWSTNGYLVPTVYRDTSLWTGPTYSKGKKQYLVDQSEYVYNETAGTVTFLTQQDPSVYVYVSLDYPYLRASSQDNRLCSDCHTEATHKDNNCLVCHTAHNTENIYDIREKVRLPNRSTANVKFYNFGGVNSFADGDMTYDGICEVCHTQTKYYKRDGSGFANHSGGYNYDGTNCGSCHSHAVGMTKAGFDVNIVSPFNNMTTSDSDVMVTGSIVGRDRAEVGVTVNGTLAEVNGDTFALAGLPLVEGANTITAVATDANGMTATNFITVYGKNVAAPRLSITATPSSGQAPLAVTLAIECSVADAASFELDFGDGSDKVTATTLVALGNSLSHTYAADGLYYPTVKVTDGAGKAYSKKATVNVKSAPDLAGMWNTFRTYISQGKINDAVKLISIGNRESYRNNLTTLAQVSPQALQNVSADMADMQIYETGNGFALGDFRFVSNGQLNSFGIQFQIDEDGIWRIEKF